MMQNPGMMRQEAEMVRSMDPAQLQSMAIMAGAPGRGVISHACVAALHCEKYTCTSTLQIQATLSWHASVFGM